MITGTLEDMLRDMKNGVYDYTKDGECIGCGECCSNFLPLNSKDIKNISRYIEKKHIKEQKHFPFAEGTYDATCPFRSDEEKKCLVYQVRPAICKSFKCDLPKQEVKCELKGDFKLYNMRELFYGTEDSDTTSTPHEEKS